MTEERFHEDESRGHTCMDYAEARKKSHEMQQRIEWLLELQEHPEQLTDEQFLDEPSGKAERQQILADDEMRQLVQQLGFAKRAFKYDELKSDTPDVDAEWEKFAASHAEELEILDEGERLRERLRVGDGTSGMGDGTSGIYKPRLRAYLAPRKILGRAKRQSRCIFYRCTFSFGHCLCRHPSCAKHQHPQTATALYGASDRHEASHLPTRRYGSDRHNFR